MKHQRALMASPFSLLCFFLSLTLPLYGKASKEEESAVMEKSEWRRITSSEYGQVSAIDIKDGSRAPFHLQFFTLESNSLFLPVLLHADMLFYVQTGSGRLISAYDGDTKTINLRQGDICVLGTGLVFYLQSNLEAQRHRLRIIAIFPNSIHGHYDPVIGAYSRISELVGGFDQKIIQAALGVPEELAAEISNKTETPAIVHAVSKKKNYIMELEAWILNRVLGGEIATDVSSNDNKPRTFNVFDKHPDFKNRYGWSLMVTQKHLKSLKHINISFLMVNLTAGAMMGPHWNPLATEIAMVLEGEGMVRVVCGGSNMDKSKCQNMRFKVKKGDVFMVPRFHPMAQMSFNNDSLVFLGFSTTTKKTYPHFLAGKRSVLQTIDRHILAASFNVRDTTIEQLLHSQKGSVILGCASCAEEEEKIMMEEAKRREEEEARRRQEEEARRREQEKKREEEEARRREEVKKREEEKKAKQEQEEAKRQQERRQEERERKRQEEEAKEEQERAKREQEERERRRQKEEEEELHEQARRQQEEEAEKEQELARKEQKERERKRQQEEAKEEEEQVQRKQEVEAKREQEQAKREQEERERTHQQEEEKEQARRRQEEKERRHQREEEELKEQARRQQEEEAQREHEGARKEQQERERMHQKEEEEELQEQARRQREVEAKREHERARKEQEERERRHQKEQAKEEQEQVRRQQEEEATREQERGRKEQEERERKRQQEEEQVRRKQENIEIKQE